VATEANGSGEAQSALETSAPSTSVWTRIKDHKIAQWTLAYGAAAYALLDGTKIASDAFDWPHQVLRIVMVLLVLGVPVVVTLAWYHGHKALRRVSGPELSILIALLVVAAGVLWWASRHERSSPPAASDMPRHAPSQAKVFTPPPHSIAVLPFVNMSGDKEQEYFSEGLTEEVLNSLARLNELQVAARTSSFSFQGEHPDITTVAHRLNVGAVLEGSVRRSGHTVRVTTQLVNGITGFHLWSETYDRDLKDVLKLQSEIANAVADALQVTLLGDVAAKIELGGTRNPAAFDAYLRASKALLSMHDQATDMPPALAAYTEAIQLDPNYALALAARSYALANYAAEVATGTGVREGFEKAEADAHRALAVAPELAEAHQALAYIFEIGTQDFKRASEEYERAVALAPGNAQILGDSGLFAAYMGHFEPAISALRRAVVLDPLDQYRWSQLGWGLYVGRRYHEATSAYAAAINLSPDSKWLYGQRGFVFIGLGDFESARASCETHRDDPYSRECLAVVYEKLGRHSDAKAELTKMQAALGDAWALEYAKIYAQWGDNAKALEWLETALRLRDTGLPGLKVHPLLDPLRKEPRFKAVQRALKFPD
jgi:TolB-like protein/Flp pilus assembly protein TadD